MNWQQVSPQRSPETVNRVIVLEAEPGPARDAVIQQWLAEARQIGATCRLLNCAYTEGGIWAGIADLFQDLVPQIRERAPHLLTKHSYELCLVLPSLRQHLPVRNPTLTETASEKEKTRNFPADRAYRSLHGLIDLLDSWSQFSPGSPCAIVCDKYDQANSLVHRFFAELMRRRGQSLQLSLLVATTPGTGDATAHCFDPSVLVEVVLLDLPCTPRPLVSKEHMAQRAKELEGQMQQNAINREAYLPLLIHYWQQSESPDNALSWQIEAMHRYNHQGLYEASRVYSESVEAHLEHLYAEDEVQYYHASYTLYFCYVPIGEVGRAQRVLEELLARTTDRRRLPDLYYLIAMQYARYLPASDLTKAEEYLQRSLTLLPEIDLPDDERHFSTVFCWNGLAFVRLRQGRPQEAVDLCHKGITLLNEHLEPGRHRLHRSVLLYNIAQVYAQVGPYEESVTFFKQAMDMDPNYSEYYNERGNVYMSMGRLHEAEQDYFQAIELSPPYAEAWTNLGQCYRAMGRMADAAHAYSVALDLDPSMTLAIVGRAGAYTALDEVEAALADYDAALALDRAQPLVLASRAIIQYESGYVAAALGDLNEAVALAPEIPDLYRNRAVALSDLNRFEEATQDLHVYLQLEPDAEDRHEVEHMILSLQASAVSKAVTVHSQR
jgi:tetratricopeptide (TPR) repeat protein